MVTRITYQQFVQNLHKIFNTEYVQAYCVISEGLEVHTGNENDCNYEYCEQHNIPVYDLHRSGGTIVCCDGTIGVALIANVENGWMHNKFTDAFIQFLNSKGINNISVDDNDILVDGYKVASSVEKRVNENLSMIFGGYLISYDVNLEAIQNICTKQIVKTPRGLVNWGITKQEIIDWVDEYFTELEYRIETGLEKTI